MWQQWKTLVPQLLDKHTNSSRTCDSSAIASVSPWNFINPIKAHNYIDPASHISTSDEIPAFGKVNPNSSISSTQKFLDIGTYRNAKNNIDICIWIKQFLLTINWTISIWNGR